MAHEPRTFNLPALNGISPKQIEVHLGLYAGYVKHMNVLGEQIKKLKESGADPYVIAEVRRRLGFEFNGMRLHEFYFEQFENASTSLSVNGALAKAATEKYGSPENLEAHIREVTGSRGIGWVITYYDPITTSLYTAFVNDHEVGQLAGVPIILALDLWEHAYMVDYVPAEKKNYIDAFFENLNWAVVEKRFEKVA